MAEDLKPKNNHESAFKGDRVGFTYCAKKSRFSVSVFSSSLWSWPTWGPSHHFPCYSVSACFHAYRPHARLSLIEKWSGDLEREQSRCMQFCVHEGNIGTDESAQILIQKNKRTTAAAAAHSAPTLSRVRLNPGRWVYNPAR